MRGSARHATTATVACLAVQTRVFWSTIPCPTLSFVSFFGVELPFLVLLPHPAFSVALHQGPGILFTSMIVFLTFTILSLPQLIQELDVDPRKDDDASPMSSYRCMLRPT